MEKFDAIPGMILSIIGGMAVMHFILTEDSKEAHKDQAHLIMRFRHYKKMKD